MTRLISALAYLSQAGEMLPKFWGIVFKEDAFIAFAASVVAYLLYGHRILKVSVLGVARHSIGLLDLWIAIGSLFIFEGGQAPYYVSRRACTFVLLLSSCF